MAKAPTAPKRGRPSMGKRGTFKFRVTEALRENLERVSAQSGRPVSEEIEIRLEQSLSYDKFFGPPANWQLARQILLCLSTYENSTGKRWDADQTSRRQILAAITRILLPGPPLTAIPLAGCEHGSSIGDIVHILSRASLYALSEAQSDGCFVPPPIETIKVPTKVDEP